MLALLLIVIGIIVAVAVHWLLGLIVFGAGLVILLAPYVR